MYSELSKVSKRNIEALGRANFSARIDFSVEGGLQIAEIESVNNFDGSTFYKLNNSTRMQNKLHFNFDLVR